MRIQCALIAFTLHFSRNLTFTLRPRMSRDCHACAVLLVKNGSSTVDNRDASLLSMVPRRVAELLLFGRPARRQSRMCMQLMASVRHAIDNRDASLLPMGMYVRTIT